MTTPALAADSAYVAEAPARDESPPLAGFRDGLFYLRDKDDVFRLYVQGRVHVDALASLGPGVNDLPADAGLGSGIFLRRARTEVAGEFFEKWQWQLSAEFGPTALDNAGARVETRACSVDPKTGALTCVDQSAAVQAPQVKPAPTDVFVNFAASPYFNVQVGQYLVPFGMEARVSDNTTYFLERSMTTRLYAAPTTRDIGAMAWGELPSRALYYTVGIYNGDGQNRLNVDSRYDLVARVLARPFVTGGPRMLADAQVGASVRAGSRDGKSVAYDITPFTTQGGYSFFRATYKDSAGHLTHIIPSTEQSAIGADLYVPLGRFDLSGEVVVLNENTREAWDGYQLYGSARKGSLRGASFYAQASYWVLGERSLINYPSVGKPLHLDFEKPHRAPTHGVQLVAKYERFHAGYDGSRRGGVDDALTPTGDIDVHGVSFGVNYWATRHVRVSLDYSGYVFPDSAPASATQKNGPVQTSSQRATAPGQLLAKGVNDSARDGAHALHELQARVGVQF